MTETDDRSAQMRVLARRVRQRRAEWERAHPGRRLPITDTLSRILEHDPEYTPLRPRRPTRVRPPLLNPGIFTVQAIARDLHTTVGDLLGEPSALHPVDVLSVSERTLLRTALEILITRFDLHDPDLSVGDQVEGTARRDETVVRALAGRIDG